VVQQGATEEVIKAYTESVGGQVKKRVA
jgi:hypothetical protein